MPLTAFTILGGALAIGVGFGSQALINNFIGGLIMLAERPVRLGERITFGNFDGVVEDVGFRCTKLRTATDHLVTIPNSTLVNESIENVARRRTIRRLLNITIPSDTPRDRIAAAVQAIRDILEEKDIRERIHPIVGFEEFPPRVFFSEFNARQPQHPGALLVRPAGQLGLHGPRRTRELPHHGRVRTPGRRLRHIASKPMYLTSRDSQRREPGGLIPSLCLVVGRLVDLTLRSTTATPPRRATAPKRIPTCR